MNAGLLQTSGVGSFTLTVPFQNTATGTVKATSGLLRLRGVNDISGRLEVDRTTDATALLSIGGASLSSALTSPTIQLTAGGVVEIQSGISTLTGTLQVAGTGMVEQTAGTLLVNTLATIETGPTSKVRLNGSTAIVQTDNALSNRGLLEWRTATLRGMSGVANGTAGTIEIVSGGTPRMGDSTAAGQILNLGSFRVQTGAALLLDDNSELNNKADGAPARLELAGTGSIRKLDSSVTGAVLVNTGAIYKTGAGTADITVNYEQDGSGLIVVEAGTLRFSGITMLTGGSAQIETGAIEFNGPTTLGTIHLTPSVSSARIDFGGAGITHTLDGTLTDSGDGDVRLVNGTFTGGLDGGTLQLLSGFLHTAGTMTGVLENKGSVVKTGGTTSGDFTNAVGATFEMNSTVGALTGNFANHGEFGWFTGPVGGTFLNLKDAGAGLAQMVLLGTGSKSIPVNGLIDNLDGLILHTNTAGTNELQLLTNATILNRIGGEYVFSGSSGAVQRISPAGGAVNTVFANNGAIVKTGQSAATISTELDNANAIIEVQEGALTISGPAAIATGAFFATAAGSSLNFTGGGSIAGSVFHNVSAPEDMTTPAGLISYRTQPFQVVADFEGEGRVEFRGTFDVIGDTSFALTAGEITSSTLNVSPTVVLLNTANLLWSSSTASLASTATFRNEGSMTFAGSTGNTLTTTAGATGARFRNAAEINYDGGGALVLDRAAVFENDGDFLLHSDADIIVGGSASGATFINRKTFAKPSAGLSVVSVPFDNQDFVSVSGSGTLQFIGGVVQFTGGHLTGGKWQASEGGTLDLGPGTLTTIDPGAELRLIGAGSRCINLPAATGTAPVTLAGGLSLQNTALDFNLAPVLISGATDIDGGSSLQTLNFQNLGSTKLNGTLTSTQPALNTATGSLSGGGLLIGGLSNAGGVFPGNSPGTLTINGSFEQQATGTLGIEIGGLAIGSASDLLSVSGPVVLAGELEVIILFEAFGLPAGSVFTILTGSSITGTFSTLDFPREAGTEMPAFSVRYLPTSVQLTALITLPEPGAASLLAAGVLALGCRRNRRRGRLPSRLLVHA